MLKVKGLSITYHYILLDTISKGSLSMHSYKPCIRSHKSYIITGGSDKCMEYIRQGILYDLSPLDTRRWR